MRSGSLIRGVMGLILVLGLAGCDGSRQEPEHKSVDTAAADTAATLKQNLPSGRFQLPTRHTPAPDLWITLPEGYMVKNVGKLPNDMFFIVDSDDPSLDNRDSLTPGFLRVYVGVMPQSALDTSVEHATRPIVIAGRPLELRSWKESVPQTRGPYHQREIVSSDFFAPLSFELAKTPLHIQFYAAGFDSARVAELSAAALTIGFTP